MQRGSAEQTSQIATTGKTGDRPTWCPAFWTACERARGRNHADATSLPNFLRNLYAGRRRDFPRLPVTYVQRLLLRRLCSSWSDLTTCPLGAAGPTDLTGCNKLHKPTVQLSDSGQFHALHSTEPLLAEPIRETFSEALVAVNTCVKSDNCKRKGLNLHSMHETNAYAPIAILAKRSFHFS